MKRSSVSGNDKSKKLKEDNIQPDYSIKLNDFQLIKKFSGIRLFNTLIFYDYILSLKQVRFIVTFERGGVKLTPYFNKSQDETIFEKIKKDILEEGFLHKFISYQLLNSGILEQLSTIPPHEATIRGEVVTNKIVVVLNGSEQSITSYDYHNDSNLFQILKYFKSDLTPVLGSEILFTDQRKYVVHGHMSREGNYSTIEGDIAHTQELINDMYDSGLVPENVLLRGLYNSGDTFVINDMLVKHAVINPDEERIGDILKIKVYDGQQQVDINVDIQVCRQRIQTTRTHHSKRGIIKLIVYHNYASNTEVNYIPLADLDHELSFFIDSVKIDIPEVNFNIKEYATFLNTISTENTESGQCVVSRDITILSRGGCKRCKTKRKKRLQKSLRKLIQIRPGLRRS